MGFSENPKFLLLTKKIFKKWKIIGLIVSIIGFFYFCIFNKISKNAELDARTFTPYPGNSTLNEENENFFKNTNNYFLNYKYEGEHIIDIIQEYINRISPFIETEKHKITLNSKVDDYILLSNVPCKFCNNIENLIIVINFDYKERKYFHSLTVGLTLIHHFSNCNYMSKDIIFLFMNKELLYSSGIQEFIQFYFYGNLNNRKSITRSATIIEFDSIYPSSIKINYNSLNGMLPNQDLILLLTNELYHYSIPVKTEQTHNVIFDMAFEKNYEKGHIHFLRENIPSFTTTGISKIPLKNKMINLFDFTKALQSYLRSQSNTHEGFCHSSNFYFFDTIKKHIPISIYCYSVYLICCYCILKLMKSKIFRNYINFLIGLYTYIITILIISLPMYLLSSNDKIYDFLNLEKKLPLCDEWHPDNFMNYIKITDYWINIFIISLAIAFVFNYFILYIVNKFHKINGYCKVKKVEKVVILEKIRDLKEKKKKLSGLYLYNKNYEKDLNLNSDVKENIIKPKVIHSDDENFILEKKNRNLIKDIQNKIEKMETKLKILDNENVKYIFKNSVAPYSLIMNYINIFFFILIVLLSSLYNWSYSVIFCITFVVPISLLHNIKKKPKKIVEKIIILFFIIFTLIYIYPYENFILNERHKMTNFLMNIFNKCEKYLINSKWSKMKYFPEFFYFVCSNKYFDYLYTNKYFLNNQDIKFNYNNEIKNGVLLNIYNIARNHYCIGSLTYPLLCFTLFPIYFYILFIFFFA
ncbi:glycosylphosphatidylinositol anchor attachment 1 protein, putative [Plasmodium gallinaceum]|uniref:Glycosylphosphatidylinositol anchor attachment 1 protein, putative n=1 Tax=Plasmodium gallinaceum TaxID=5849 RepID=A0A1J1GRW4_PLAGA|nr:glycosylphosphatidylinositol anchor attachment 1 protein, putative [Plasmodium gallinaceum]CRG94048.1 glycosylphosphatidylinositol anchor attachment 1 protein, putative [Plasmodium gallinaceum]